MKLTSLASRRPASAVAASAAAARSNRWAPLLSSLLATLCLFLALNAPSIKCQQYGPTNMAAVEAEAAAAAAYEAELVAPTRAQSHSCVLTIKQSNHSANSYSTAMVNSYLTNYVTSGRREPYHHKGGSICITQHDVDAAIEEAKASLGGYVPKEIYTANSEVPKPMHVSVVAEIITQATRILANRFKLPEPTILYDLPSIDLSKSAAIEKICPVFLKPSVNCEQTRYRTLTGFCNNLQYQSWGSTRSAMVRFLAPDYYDSISLPRRAYDGSPLPSARVVSFVVHQDPPEYDKYHSMLSVVWGQFIDHDMTLAVQASDENPTSGPDQLNCCKSEDAHPDCFPIEIPKGDPFYGYFNQKCMHFTRASAGLQPGCSLGPVQAMNKISSYLDGNLVYGSGIKTNQRLRTYQGGQLRTQPVSSASAYGSSQAAAYSQPGGSLSESYAHTAGEHPASALSEPGEYLAAAGSQQLERNLQLSASSMMEQYAPGGYAKYKELLPANKHNPDVGCERRGRAKDVYCFEAGDVRANEQIQLTTMHTLLMREHNRIAKELSYINPYWDDERLFQEARQIVVAQLQHITFNEFLPLIIGKEKIYEYGLELEHPGRYYQGYDSKINAGIRVEFQAAAFRYGHSILPSYIERYNKFHQKIGKFSFISFPLAGFISLGQLRARIMWAHVSSARCGHR